MPEFLAPGVYIEEQERPTRIEAVSTSVAGFVGEAERGPERPCAVTSWAEYQRRFGGFVDGAESADRQSHYLPYAVRGFFENGGQRLFVARVVGGESSRASADLPGDAGPTTVRASGRGEWGNQVLVVVKRASAAAAAPANSPESKWFRLQIAYYRDGPPAATACRGDLATVRDPNGRAPDVLEDFDDLSQAPTDPNFASSVVNSRSALLEVVACSGPPSTVPSPGVRLQGGRTTPAAREDYLGAGSGDPDVRTGLAGLAAVDEVSIVAIPDEVVPALGALASDLLKHCETTSRFAILSDQAPGGEADPSTVRPPADSYWSAFYHPWIRVAAAHTAHGTKLVPAHGHVAGIYARTELDRGVHVAPADEVVRGVVTAGLAPGLMPLSRTIDERGSGLLVARGVDVIRDLRAAGRDIRVCGARTASSDPQWTAVSMRRLFTFIKRSIDRGTQWVVFEANAEPTWTRVRVSVSEFLRTVWRAGALVGRTEDEAFFVKCDRTTMTQDDVDTGRLVCLVGAAALKPGEFVFLRVCHLTAEASQERTAQ